MFLVIYIKFQGLIEIELPHLTFTYVMHSLTVVNEAATIDFVTRIWFWAYVRPEGPWCDFCEK